MYRLGRHLRTFGIIVVAMGILGATFLGGQSVLAGRPGQTVPQPTPTPEDTPVPTATSTNTPQPPPPTNTPLPTNTPESDAAPDPTATHTPTSQPAASPTPTTVQEFALLLGMGGPRTAQQGDEVRLTFVVSNPSPVVAEDVRIRDLLPASLSLISAEADGGGEVELESEGAGGTVVLFSWPELAAGAEHRASLVVEVVPDLADGSVIDNLAVAYAANASGSTAGISIGLPPAILPLFR